MSAVLDERAAAPHDPNLWATAAMTSAAPRLMDVLPAWDAVPNMRRDMILVSGPLMDWAEYQGCQRTAVLGAALFEGLASDLHEADAKLRSGAIRLGSCHDFQSVGSLTGVCTASMPVFVVENETTGDSATCRLNEGAGNEALTFGSWGQDVRANLEWMRDRVAPALGRIVRHEPLPLLPLMAHALTMGDELHGRQRAATLLFRSTVLDRLVRHPYLVDQGEVDPLLTYLSTADFLFLHVAMAAAKVTTRAAEGILGSSVVTAMSLNEKEFALSVAGAPGRWFRGRLPAITEFHAVQRAGGSKDLGYSGGDSLIMETLGLGGVAAAAAPILCGVSAGSPTAMIEVTKSMYGISVSEHPVLRIPALEGRGVPVGLDVASIAHRRLVPPVHLGATWSSGGLAGSMVFRPPLQPFIDAHEYIQRNVDGLE